MTSLLLYFIVSEKSKGRNDSIKIVLPVSQSSRQLEKSLTNFLINERIMSSRALRKLHGKQDIDTDFPLDSKVGGSESEEESKPVKKSKSKKKSSAPANPFELVQMIV